ncbi:hypothetical protein [Sulfurivermis fontis]|uniref:hypothetical protein n=1 Tax=Sulfurivermis fontis TaxID=1972068 RepID=UPI0018D4EFD4|nr:hypothetical protein [Sulfurivermis fontis]
MMKLLHTLLAAAALSCASLAFAHSDEYLDTIVTPHGGQMRMAGMHHFELVVEQGTLTVYLTDHADQPVASAGASGSATVLVGRNRSTIVLTPAGDNRLTGQGEFTLDAAMRVVLSISVAGQPAEQARFTPLAPRQVKAIAAEHNHDSTDAHHHH